MVFITVLETSWFFLGFYTIFRFRPETSWFHLILGGFGLICRASLGYEPGPLAPEPPYSSGKNTEAQLFDLTLPLPYLCLYLTLPYLTFILPSPGVLRGDQGKPRGTQGIPGDPRGPQGTPGDPRGPQGSPGDPRRAHGTLGFE